MTPQEFREILSHCGISQAEAARRLTRDGKTINRWANGHHPIPLRVAEEVRKWGGIRPQPATPAGKPR